MNWGGSRKKIWLVEEPAHYLASRANSPYPREWEGTERLERLLCEGAPLAPRSGVREASYTGAAMAHWWVWQQQHQQAGDGTG